jgi:hypothetical protein
MITASAMSVSPADLPEGPPMALSSFLTLASPLNVTVSARKRSLEASASSGRAGGISQGKGAEDSKEA